jgi:uncharacterized protein involved in type VI secretion and phage assembly
MAPDDLDDDKVQGLHIGVVTDTADPVKAGRVRIRIPGLIDEGSAWAIPGSFGGGAPQRGVHWVPPVGAQVAVMFIQGDPDRPMYFGAQALQGQFLTGTDGDPNTMAIETAGYVIAIDDRPESKSLTIQDKASGDTIQLNGRDRSIAVRATAAVTIEATGFVYINALGVFINGMEAGLGKL